MKKVFLHCIILALGFCGSTATAQSPELMSYQAIMRDPSGLLLKSAPVAIRFSIRQSTTTGTIVYAETQNVMTNINGVITAAIGSGKVISGTIADIDWSEGPYFIQTETDSKGSGVYTITVTSQLLSVPYALYAKTSGTPVTASNGDTLVGHDIQLGSSLTRPTTIGTSSTNTLSITGLQPGTINDSILTIDPETNVIRRTDPKSLKFWALSGNTATSSYVNCVGTLNDVPLILRSSGSIAGRIGSPTTDNNTSFGYEALSDSITVLGTQNTAFGYLALHTGRKASYNTAVGYCALLRTRADNNTGIGNNSLYNNDTGHSNTAIGSNALYYNKIGNGNTAVGFKTLFYNDSGSYNTAIGFMAGTTPAMHNVSNTISIGNGSGGIVTASNRTEIGNTSMSWIGGQVSWSTYSDKRIKKDIKYDIPGLDFIKQLRPVTYHIDARKQYQLLAAKGIPDTIYWQGKYDIEQITQTGFIAQEVAAAAKTINYDFSGVQIPKDENDLYSIRYSDFVMPLVKAVQEQQIMIQQLINKNKELEASIQQLEKIKETSKTIVPKTTIHE